jgi:IclR family acetate operon transcriptional repressor
MAGVKALQTVDRAFAVLDALAERQPVGVGELAREMGLDKSALQRVLVSLHSAGWIRADGSNPTRWVLTTKPLQLARRATGAWLVTQARSLVERLSSETGETVYLCVVDGRQIVVVDGVESSRALRASVRRGLLLPHATSAAGKALLARMDERDWEQLLDEPATAQLRKAVAAARRTGYATNVGEVDPSINAAGAAVTDARAHPIAALIVCGPADRLQRDVLTAAGEAVARHAGELSRAIG